MMLHQGTVVWLIADSARTPQRITAVLSACRPTWKPGQSTRCTTGRWKVCAMSTKRMILLHASAVQAPPSNSGSPAITATGQPSSRAKPVMMERPNSAPISKKLSLSNTRSDDPAHVVGLLLHLRHRRDQRLIAPVRIIPAAHPRRHVMDRARQIGQEPPGGVERLFLGIDRVIDGAAAQLDLPAAEFLLGARLAQPFDDRRAGDEDRGDFLHHDRVVRGDQARGAEAGDRAEAQADDRHLRHLVRDQVERGGLRQPAGQVGASGGFDRLDRSAAAGAFDQPDDRHAELGGDLLRHLGLALDRGIGRSAAQGEVVAGDNDRAAVHRAAAEHAVAWR